MNDVKWIKLDANIFDNRKIRQIESLPDGAEIIVCWLKLLCLAGNTNDAGMIYLTKDVPYTDQMLSTQFGTPLATIQLALRTFEQFGMIKIVDNFLFISNWEKYQNIDGMDKIRAQNRQRQAAFKQRKRELLIGNVTDNVTVTHGNATEEEIEEDIKKETLSYESVKKENGVSNDFQSRGADAPPPAKAEKPAVVRKKYGQYGWVRLSDDDYNRLLNDLGENEVKRCIAYVDEAAQKTNNKNKWRDWNLTVRHCHRDGWGLKNKPAYAPQQSRAASSKAQELDEFYKMAAEWAEGDG